MKANYSNLIYLISLINKASPFRIVGNVLVGILTNVYYLLFSVLFVKILYTIIENKDPFVNALIVIIIACLLHHVLHWYECWYHNWFMPISNNRVNAGIFRKIVMKAIETKQEKFDDPEFYNQYARAIDESIKRADELTETITQATSSFCVVIVAFLLIWAVDPVFLLFAILGPLIVALFTGRIKNRLEFELNQALTKHNRVTEYTRRIFFEGRYSREIRMTKIADLVQKQHDEATIQITSIHRKYQLKIAFINILDNVNSLMWIEIAAISYITYKIIYLEGLSAADYVAMISAIASLNSHTTSFFSVFTRFGQNALHIQNLRDFLESPSHQDGGEKEIPIIEKITFENVSFHYKGSDNLILKNISFEINKNEKISVVGLNGAGKTTMIKLMLGLYEPCAGKICINGKDISSYDRKEYYKAFATMFQDYQLFALSINENVKMDIVRPEDEGEILDALGFAEFYENLDPTIVGDTALTKEYEDEGIVLSGGQQQKLALGRAFYKKGQIIILDEPSSALDPIAEYQIYENMLKLAKNKIVVFISHRMSTAVIADKVFLFKEGELVERGSHVELMQAKGLYSEMFSKQAENYIMMDGTYHEAL